MTGEGERNRPAMRLGGFPDGYDRCWRLGTGWSSIQCTGDKTIRETAAWPPRLARRELAATVCEHWDWHTASGTLKRQACQRLLERLAAAGLVELPSLRGQKVHTGERIGIALSERTATVRPLAGSWRDFEPVRWEPVMPPQEMGLWDE